MHSARVWRARYYGGPPEVRCGECFPFLTEGHQQLLPCIDENRNHQKAGLCCSVDFVTSVVSLGYEVNGWEGPHSSGKGKTKTLCFGLVLANTPPPQQLERGNE